MEGAFRGASNMQITATEKPDLSGVTSMAVMFFGAYTFNGNISGWNVSAVTNMSFMFFHATAFNGDIGGWDVSAVRTMAFMFKDATAFRQNLGLWYIVPGTTASYDGKTNLEVLGLSAQNAVLDGQTPEYRLVAGEGDGDNGSFTLTDGALNIKAAEASGGDYRIRIAAGGVAFGTNNARAITVVVPVSTPDAPTSLTAVSTPNGTGATITWTAPSNTGGAAITGYTVQRAPGTSGGTFATVSPAHTGTGTTYTDSGLSPGTTYRYQVAANNGTRTSATAEASVTTFAVPDAPTISTIVSTSNGTGATITWTAPSNTGGAAITGYTVQRAPGTSGGTFATVSPAHTGTGTTYTDSGLSPGTTYRYQVAANNGTRTSATAEASVTTFAVPDAPTISTIVSTSNGTGATITWTAPTNTGGAAITGYRLERAGTDGSFSSVYTGPSTNYVDRNLPTGTTYRYRVLATNDVGEGSYSTEADVTIFAVPDAPTNVVVVLIRGSGTSARLTWGEPTKTGGDVITGYAIERESGGSTTIISTGAGTVSPYDDTGLTFGTTYRYQVAAINSAGTGAYSGSVFVTINPALTLAASDQIYTVDVARSLTLPAATDGTAPYTSYTLTPLPANLAFDGDVTKRILSGAPTVITTGIELTYMVTDSNDVTAEDTFRVIVNAAPVALELSDPDDLIYTAGEPITDVPLPSAAGGTGTLNYALIGTLPDGLTVTPAVFPSTTAPVISGMPRTQSAAVTLTYEVTDSASTPITKTQTFTITVNPALTLTKPADRMFTANMAIGDVPLPGATAPYTYALTGPNDVAVGAAIPNLSFDRTTHILSGTLTGDVETVTLTYTVTDSNGATAEDTFTVTVNAALTLNAPSDQTYTMGTRITTLTLPVAAGGTGALSYTLTGDLPAGLSFDADTRMLSGTPKTEGTTTLTYRVTDTNGASAEVTFTVTVNAGLTLNAPSDQTYTLNTAIADLTLPVAAGGTAPYTYTLTGTLPTGLNFNAATHMLRGTPTVVTAAVTLTHTVLDANGAAALATFTVTVTLAPLALTDPANQTFTVGARITDLTLPQATGGIGSYTYTLTGTLPTGLNFNAATHMLRGTPTAVAAAVTLSYRVTDSATPSATETQEFTITIDPENGFAELNEAISLQIVSAIVSNTTGAIGDRTSKAASGIVAAVSWDEQISKSLTSLSNSNGDIDLKKALSTVDIAMPLLNASGSNARNSLSLWIGGNYRNISGKRGVINWDGELYGINAGIDTQIAKNILAGVAVSWSQGDLDYKNDDKKGDYEIDMLSVNPYLGWNIGKVDMWGTLGYGQGNLETTPEMTLT